MADGPGRPPVRDELLEGQAIDAQARKEDEPDVHVGVRAQGANRRNRRPHRENRLEVEPDLEALEDTAEAEIGNEEAASFTPYKRGRRRY